jgi:hypothetical protein
MKLRDAAVIAAVLISLSGCAVIAVTDALITTGAVTLKGAAKVTGAAVDVATYPFRGGASGD